MDVGASFQFLVDALARDWYAIAPDLRGYGRSAWQPQGYWFPDYVADLEALLDVFAPGETVDLVGHSLGGNIVMHYAGVRPQRVRARGLARRLRHSRGDAGRRAEASSRSGSTRSAAPPRFQAVRDLDAVADRLQKNNPRLPRDEALFLAAHWAEVAARRQRAPAVRPAAQAAVSVGVPDGGGLRDLAPDHRAGAVGRRGATRTSRSGSTSIRKARSAPTTSPASAAADARAARPPGDDRRRRRTCCTTTSRPRSPRRSSRSFAPCRRRVDRVRARRRVAARAARAARRCTPCAAPRGRGEALRDPLRRRRLRGARRAHAALGQQLGDDEARRSSTRIRSLYNIQRTLVAIAVLFAVLLWQRRPLLPESWRAVVVTGFFQTTINFGSTTDGAGRRRRGPHRRCWCSRCRSGRS